MEEILKPREAAKFLRVSYDVILKLANAGKIGGKVGERWRFPKKDLERYVSSVVVSGGERPTNDTGNARKN